MSRFLLLVPACVCVCVCYLVGVCMSERCVVLAGAVGGPVFIHGWGGWGFIEQAALCGRGRERIETLGKFPGEKPGGWSRGAGVHLPSVFPLLMPGYRSSGLGGGGGSASHDWLSIISRLDLDCKGRQTSDSQHASSFMTESDIRPISGPFPAQIGSGPAGSW